MEKEFLIGCLSNGMSTRDIEKICNKKRSTISYWIDKYELNQQSIYKKNDNFLFEKIDTKEKAYCLGFILADASINNLKDVELSIAIQDKQVVDFISSVIGANVTVDTTMDKKKRRFPRARMHKRIKDISKFTGGEIKKDRHYPRVNEKFEKYLIQGLFDAEGCVTWGFRKDKNRLWHKISFTSSLKILEGVQQLLIKKLSISTVVRPKSDEDCFVLEFANKKDIITFLNYIYSDDFIILERKYFKSRALRLELDGIGGTHKNDNTEVSLQGRKP